MAIVIIDYGMSNLGSIRRSIEECGSEVFVSTNPEDLKQAERIVLPGVGSFADGIKNLKEGGWIEILKDEVLNNKIPLLGICLGMQLLADEGIEEGVNKGLGLISGKVEKLSPQNGHERLPHVGWNEVKIVKENPLFEDIKSGQDFYFVHSFHFVPEKESSIIAKTPYCGGFVSAVNIDNIFGTQFHPEKSVPTGFQILRNFINY